VRCTEAFSERPLEAVDHRPEREPPGAEHLEDELLLPLAEIGSGKRYLSDQGLGAAGVFSAYSSQRVQRPSRPRTASKKADWIALVTGPGGPIS
jgi:hypothetical protein